MALSVTALFAGQVLLSRSLDPVVFGQLLLVLAWISGAVIVAAAGHQLALGKMLPRLIATGNTGAVRPALHAALKSTATSAMVVAGVLTVIAMQGSFGFPRVGVPGLLATVVLVPVLALSAIRVATATALTRLWLAHLPDSIIRPLVVGIGAAALARASHPLSLEEGLLMTAVVATAGNIVGGAWLSRRVPDAGPQLQADLQDEASRTARYLGTTATLVAGTRVLDLIVAGMILTPASFALYGVLTRLGELANTVYVLIDPVFLARFSALSQTGQRSALARAVTTYVSASVAWSLAALALGVLFGTPLLSLFGPAYAPHRWLLVGVIAASSLNALTGPGGQLLTYGGEERMVFLTSAACSAAYLIVLPFALHAAGVAGAVAAFAGYQLVRGLVQAAIVRSRLGVAIIFGGRVVTP